MSDKVPLTAKGANLLQKELKRLKSHERPAVIRAIAEARAHGDLKENAEYHAAKDQQGFIEGRIKDIDGKLSNAQIIDIRELPYTGKVVFGATVVLFDLAGDKEVRYQVVGEDEANVKQGLISYTSPLVRAMIGRSEGDEIEIDVPDGAKQFEILEVIYE